MLAEDEEAVRDLACEFLTAAGYRVIVAHDGEKALEIAETLNEPIHLLVTDVVMPKMRGPELAERLKRLRPEIKVLYMSGYVDQSKGSEYSIDDSEYLQKPFSRSSSSLRESALALSKATQSRRNSGGSSRRVAGNFTRAQRYRRSENSLDAIPLTETF